MKKPLKLSIIQRWEKKSKHELEPAEHNAYTQSQEQKDCLKRSIQLINDDVIEIKNHFAGKRWLFLLYFLVFNFFIFVQPYIKHGDIMPIGVWGLISPQYYAEQSMLEAEAIYGEHFSDKDSFRSRTLQYNLDKAKDARIFGIYTLIIAFGPLLVWLFGPFRGVRIDRKRQVIYAYTRGQLYCHKVSAPNLSDLNIWIYKTGLLKLMETSPLIYILPNAKKPQKGREFHLGHSPVACFNQASLLNNAIANFLYEKSDPLWLQELKQGKPYKKNYKDILGILSRFCILKTRWPPNIEQKVDAYLAKSKCD